MKPRRILHLIGNAHLDPVWLWPWSDGCSEALTTLQSAVNFLEAEPDFRFTRSSSEIYRWVETADPRLFGRIKDFVAEGRWEIVGGWIEQPDCNLPSSESFVRQSLYGKGYFQDRFGIDVKIGYNVDSFGHSAGLPQLLRRAGFTHYVFMRPPTWERELPILFWWESDDGSRVLSWRIPQNYGQPPHSDADYLEAEIRKAATEGFPPGCDEAMFFYGVGNHGGGPTRRQLERIRKLQADPDLPELRLSTVGEFFQRIEGTPVLDQIPVLRDELNKHAAGCYAAHRGIKWDNRRIERLLPTAECATVAARLTTGETRWKANLQRPWEHLLFNHFHDILCGTCTASNDVSIRDRYGAAAHPADEAKVLALHRVAREVDLSAGVPEGALFLWNPLPWSRQVVVSLDTFERPNGGEPMTRLRALDDGELIPIQWSKAEPCFGPMGAPWRKLNTEVSLPACGYRVFALEREPIEAPEWDPGLDLVDGGFGLRSWGEPDASRLLSAPLSLSVWKDNGDTWGHRVDAYEEFLGKPDWVSTEPLQSGPHFHSIRQTARWKNSILHLEYRRWRQRPGVELYLRFNWQEEREILRLELPTCLQQTVTRTPIPGGLIERASGTGEQPGGEWVALTGTDPQGQPASLLFVTDGGLSYAAQDGTLLAMLARSGYYAHHRPQEPQASDLNPFLDQGWQEARCWIHGGAGDSDTIGAPHFAAERLHEVEIVADSAHPGTLPPSGSLLEIDGSGVLLLASKLSEDDRSWIVRLQETRGKDTVCTLRSQLPASRSWVVDLPAFAIATFRLPLEGDSPAVPVDFLET